MMIGMNVAIPHEFEVYARHQVQAGTVASEEEAVAAVLRGYLARRDELREMIAAGLTSVADGKGLDGPTAMRNLIDKTRARYGG